MYQPEPWEHKSGYRLNADGKAIRYEHPETGFEAYIECTLNEHEGEMHYIPSIFDKKGTMVTFEKFYDKDSGMKRLKEMMKKYS